MSPKISACTLTNVTPGFDQPPGDQQARAAQVAAVAVAHGVGLFRQVEGLAGLARREQRKRLLAVTGSSCRSRGEAFNSRNRSSSCSTQRAPAVEPIDRHVGQGVERRHQRLADRAAPDRNWAPAARGRTSACRARKTDRTACPDSRRRGPGGEFPRPSRDSRACRPRPARRAGPCPDTGRSRRCRADRCSWPWTCALSPPV